jgi:hypothetical protein
LEARRSHSDAGRLLAQLLVFHRAVATVGLVDGLPSAMSNAANRLVTPCR